LVTSTTTCAPASASASPSPVTVSTPVDRDADVSASYLAKQLQAMSRAGLVRSTQGNLGGYELTRPPSRITVLDVVEAVDGPTPAFLCTDVRARGPLAASPEACRTPCAIHRAMTAADEAWRASLRSVTIADLAAQVTGEHGRGVLDGVRNWFNAAP
jgi:Rrf2 family protein